VLRGVPDPERWRLLEDLFQAACDLTAIERTAFLDRACGSDAAIRAEVESLLVSADQTVGFIQQPVSDAARNVSSGFPPSGKRIGPYELCSLIGQGGMGQVYLAHRADKAYSQQVALKLIRADVAADQEMLLRFRVERQILADLSHPNVARLLDGGVTPEGLPWLALEYVEGVPIDEYCRRDCLPLRARLELFLTVCSAIEYAHRNLVIHRDIKPANVLVTAEGVPKLLDFGIAKLLAADFVDSVRTRASERLMTPDYASPEQVRGEPVTTATDVYAMGVLLYELLTGQRPFRVKTDSPLEIARVICEKTPLPPSAANAADPQRAGVDSRRLKGDLDTVVLMAMRKEPERRYSSIGQLAGDIRAYLAGYPLVARGDSWSYRSRTFIARHKSVVASAALAALALTGFAIGMGMLARSANRARLTAQREAQFLAGMFLASSPEEARGQTTTARTLLDRGAARIDRELAGEPEVHASLLEVIAEAYRDLGVFDRSQALARQAFALARQSQGADSADAAKIEELLAELERDQGHYAQAERLLRELIATQQKARRGEDPQTARYMAELGECLYGEGKDDASVAVLRQALAIDRKNGPDQGADTRNYLAQTLKRKGNFEEARQLLLEAVEMDRRTRPGSQSYGVSLSNLATTLSDRGDIFGAERELRQVLEIRRRILGPQHPTLPSTLNILGSVLLRQGNWSAAEPYFKEALDIDLHTLEPNHPNVFVAKHYLDLVREAKGNFREAQADLEHILAIRKNANSGGTWDIASIVSSLGWLDFEQGDYAAAEQKARDAMEIRRKLGGDETPLFATSLMQVAMARLYQRDAPLAESLLRQTLEIRRKRLQAGHPDIAAAEVWLGQALVVKKDPAQAESILRHAVDSLEHPPFQVAAWQLAEARAAYGVCLQGLGRTAEGAALLSKSRADLQSNPRPAFRTVGVMKLLR
jgi:eukaryotic-like serine/threonine-protein kinase